jgi:putative acetyltransferase
MTSFAIRAELPGDEAVIREVVGAAFNGVAHSGGNEPDIVEGLRRRGELTVSLVALADEIVGHVAFSPVRIADGTPDWYGLGPVAVLPRRQREGVGAALIRLGLERLRVRGAAGCVVLGDPAYYGRFGFVADAELRYLGPPPEYFQRLLLRGPAPHGVVSYSPAFDGCA